jgi:hypothetical protein
MWIIDLLNTGFSPHLGALARPSTPKVLWARERTLTFYPSDVFTFRLSVESIKEFGVHHMVLELKYSSTHLLGSFNGTKEDP